jgi:DEAD/DEAH box helicase domain-containing protein
VYAACAGAGITSLWSHQREAADLARAGRHVVMSTGTASGKSLGYLLPVMTAVVEGADAPTGRGATALYLSPTKALAADQLARIQAWAVPGVRAATYDGDTPTEERRWIRDHAQLVLSNPDLVHHSLLPGHERWAPFLRALRYVVVDECHVYRGVFGSHLAALLRRLRRVCARYGASPTFVLASATVRDPALHAERLTGLTFEEVTLDGSPREAMTFALWEPGELPDGSGRRSATSEAADLLASLVANGVQTVAFARSRAGVEALATSARRTLDDAGEPRAAAAVAAYRGGYLPEERRQLERALRDGSIVGLAATNALELGVDVSGLDAVLMAGWPGTRASLWQQAGRAGRAGTRSLAVYVAADDPLDTYVVSHPEVVFGQPVEAAVLDPVNPCRCGSRTCTSSAERRWRVPCSTPWWHAASCAAAPTAAGTGRGRTVRATTCRCAAPARWWASSRAARVGCWGRSTAPAHTPRCTRGRCTCTRARRTSSPSWTSRAARRRSCGETPAGARSPSR